MGLQQGIATQSGILFGPNDSGKKYLSIYYHRYNGRPRKNLWADHVSPTMEFEVFCNADSGNWMCHRGHYWGFRDGGVDLGYCGEKLCKFPYNANINTPWHGYPVSPRDGGDRDSPSDQLVEAWIQANLISKAFGRRIQRRKI